MYNSFKSHLQDTSLAHSPIPPPEQPAPGRLDRGLPQDPGLRLDRRAGWRHPAVAINQRPARLGQEIEWIELAPYGSTQLRMTVFRMRTNKFKLGSYIGF